MIQFKYALFGFFGYGAKADDMIRAITEDMIRESLGYVDIITRVNTNIPCSPDKIARYLNLNCDGVILGGGSLLGRLRLPPFDTIEQWGNDLQIPLIILGTGWREEKKPLTKEERSKTKFLINRADYVGVRGYYSLEKIKGNHLPYKKVNVIGDPGLCYINRFGKCKLDNKSMGVVVRNMSQVEIEQDDRIGSNMRMFSIFAQILDNAREEGYDIYFFPFSSKNRTTDNDYIAMGQVQAFMKYPSSLIQVNLPLEQMVAFMGNMDFVVSQRLHGSLLSLVQGVPIMPIEYQFNKLEDSLSLDGFEEVRDDIIDAGEFSLKEYREWRRKNRKYDVRKACQQVRRNYIEIIKKCL